MSKIYDAIICGAGPAGSIAAICLKRKGFSVLLVDSQDFPRDKICGDQLPPSGVQLLNDLNIIDNSIFSEGNPIDQATIKGPYNSNVKLNFKFISKESEICIIPRLILDNKLVNYAKQIGVQRHTGKIFAIQYLHNCISIKTKTNNTIKTFQAQILIGADGSSSTIARLSNLKPWKQRGMAIRGYIDGMKLESKTIEGYFNSKWWPGYAWIFPLSNSSANIGLGMDLAHYKNCKMTFKQLLNEFIEQPFIKSRLTSDYKLKNVRTWPLNIGPPIWNQLTTDRIILIGDAAALVNPLTGGGIVNAILSGKIAAEVLSNKINNGDLSKKSLNEYIKKIKKETSKELIISKILSQFIRLSPSIIEKLIKISEKSNWLYYFMNKLYKDVQLTKKINKT